ncbi:Uncharacterised protein [Mycobacterium tuberculosis]|uniref:Uncharacterized protein n=1 Tax=Mycobacterium tuberculosis TaxID=1773 RepID=A0A655ARR7_MYCTX|nr:Uncharacterised protein [Mycobacterium tuberculosis]CKS82589.1 Uncharacterised protein [Mycobacterium tuberculosis]CKT27633.1 Uncharacterised protein [Mycobacterium tuberculosis]CKT51303.1 Uncharacterised protein [Mycobacterium tuberculosis]CKT91726.1 Uncharacterised protein [Mycobacterium tuberculosis]
MVLRHSHVSLEVTSRADFAFSRAAEIASTMEEPPWLLVLKATRSVKDQTSSSWSGGSMPSTRSSSREAWSGSTLESSSN